MLDENIHKAIGLATEGSQKIKAVAAEGSQKIKAVLDDNLSNVLDAAMEWEAKNATEIGVDPEVKHTFTPAELKRMENGDPPWESMSFACGGWLMFYMFGVAKAMQVQGVDKNTTYCGCSAGALTAAGLAVEGDFDKAVAYCKKDALPEAHTSVAGLFQLEKYTKTCLDDSVLPLFTPEKVKGGKLQVALTTLPFFMPERATVHESREDLLQSLLASAAAFPFAKLPHRKGQWCIDGGLSDFQPIVDENTITVSPFYFSDCDIKPSRYVPFWWGLLPPTTDETVDWLYNLGFDDGINYVKNRGITGNWNAAMESDILKAYKLKKQTHPDYESKKVSIHRFLGYDLKHMVGMHVAFLADLVLLALLFLIWKPICLLLIYVELWLRIISLSLQVSALSVYQNVTQNIVMVSKRAPPITRLPTKPLSPLLKSKLNSLSTKEKKEEKLWECVRCVFSLSLLLRFISGRSATFESRKQDRLARVSFLYRVFRHVI